MNRHKSILLTLSLVTLLALGALSNIHEVKAAPGFNIILSPTQQMVDDAINQYAYYSVEIQSINGFIGPVSLNATCSPSGPSLSFPGGSVVDVPLDGSGFTYLMATVGAGLVPTYTQGYTITVTGQGTSSSNNPSATGSSTTTLIAQPHQANLPKDFRLGSTPGTVVDVAPGGTGTLQINVYSYTNNIDPQSVSLLIAPSIPGLISASFTPSLLTVASYSSNVSILSLTTTLSTPSGNYSLVITGSNDDGVVHSWAITLRVSGFYIAAPAAKSVVRGMSTTIEIGVQSVGTFSSAVALSALGVPDNMTVSFNPASVTPPPGGPSASVLTISTTSSLAYGTYYLTVRGTSASLTSQQAIAITVGEFSITATPPSVTAAQNTTAIFNVNGTSSNDYSATMSLSVSGYPLGVIPTFSPSSILIPPAGSASSNLSLAISSTAPVGNYTLTITGTSGSQNHTTTVILMIVAAPDFSLSLSTSAISVRNGSSTTCTITVNSINSFNSPVTLTVSVPSGSGATGSIAPATVTPPADGSAKATLTITAAATAPAGTGTITVTGTSGTLTRTVTATLTISPTAGPCIIATATYGSELAPEVYFLRLFRDRSIQTTFAGSQFMNVFNAWYYSFSPTVAEHVKNNLALRNVAKVALYPLIGILHLAQWSYSALSFAPELAVVAAGLVASSLIGVVYFAPVVLLAVELARRKRLHIGLTDKPLAVAWLATLVLIVVAELSSLSALMMFATATFVLATVAVAAKATVTQAQKILH